VGIYIQTKLTYMYYYILKKSRKSYFGLKVLTPDFSIKLRGILQE